MNHDQPLYSLTKEGLFRRLGTGEKGLTQDEAKLRLTRWGVNKLSEKKKISPLAILFNQFKSILILILLAAAVFTYVVYFFGGRASADLVEGSLILAIILLMGILGFFQEYRAERAIAALKKLLAFRATVIRGGKQKEIDTSLLVPGDLVILEEGIKIPADIRLTEALNLHSNESSLTGESVPVQKISTPLDGSLPIADQRNMVFSSTVVTRGRGLGVVVETGDSTQIGKIATFVAETKKEETPIQKRLAHLGQILGWGTIAVSAFVFIFIVFFATGFSHLSLLQRVLQSFIAAVALAVAAIPEGLPAVVTISLAFGTQRILKRNALVRQLSSVETLGSVDVICADKTGTLTAGEMTVREIYYDGATYTVSGVGHNLAGDFFLSGKKIEPSPLSLILKAGLACNNARFEKAGEISGDPTEEALIVSAYKAAVKTVGKRIHEVPFSSERKMMSVVVEEEGKKIVYTKGAPEVVLARCTKLIKGGKAVPLNEVDKKEILEKNAAMAAAALRVLGFAYKEAEALDQNSLESNLAFIGLQAMMDSPRDEVKGLITQCVKSGIRVVMTTGDHLATAKAVASEIGIGGEAITGAELESLSEEEFEKKVEAINVYARVNPEHKLRIVEGLKKRGHLVAMSGDGVNDAPALKRADIGVAMGITGTDVAKEASDMVLLDDQFATIVAAVEEGRGIFDNIRKFVNYLLSCNVGEVLVVFFALLIFKDLPLTAVMLLWINVITDGLPAVALGLDPAEKGVLRASPKKFQEQIINQRVYLEIAIFGLALTVASLGIFALNLPEGLNEARAAVFMAIVIFELVRLVNIRSGYNLAWSANIWLPVAVAGSLALQIAIVYIPPLSSLFGVSPIDLSDWLYIIIGSVVLFLVLKLISKSLDRLAHAKTA